MVGLGAKADKGLQEARWEQGLHSDEHVLTSVPTFGVFSKRGLFSCIAEAEENETAGFVVFHHKPCVQNSSPLPSNIFKMDKTSAMLTWG